MVLKRLHHYSWLLLSVAGLLSACAGSGSESKESRRSKPVFLTEDLPKLKGFSFTSPGAGTDQATLSRIPPADSLSISNAVNVVNNYKDYGPNGTQQTPSEIKKVIDAYVNLPEILKKYIESQQVKQEKGQITTGDLSARAELARASYENTTRLLAEYLRNIAKDGHIVDPQRRLRPEFQGLPDTTIDVLRDLDIVAPGDEPWRPRLNLDSERTAALNQRLFDPATRVETTAFIVRLILGVDNDEATAIANALIADYRSDRGRLMSLADVLRLLADNARKFAPDRVATTTAPSAREIAERDLLSKVRQAKAPLSRELVDEFMRRNETSAETARRLASEYGEMAGDLVQLAVIVAKTHVDPDFKMQLVQALASRMASAGDDFCQDPIGVITTKITNSANDWMDLGPQNPVGVTHDTIAMILEIWFSLP